MESENRTGVHSLWRRAYLVLVPVTVRRVDTPGRVRPRNISLRRSSVRIYTALASPVMGAPGTGGRPPGRYLADHRYLGRPIILGRRTNGRRRYPQRASAHIRGHICSRIRPYVLHERSNSFSCDHRSGNDPRPPPGSKLLKLEFPDSICLPHAARSWNLPGASQYSGLSLI